MKYFHGTSDLFIDAIREEGLISEEGEIHCDSERYTAGVYAQQKVDRIGGKPIIVTIESDEVPGDLVVWLFGDYFSAKSIPPEAIIGIRHIKRELPMKIDEYGREILK